MNNDIPDEKFAVLTPLRGGITIGIDFVLIRYTY